MLAPSETSCLESGASLRNISAPKLASDDGGQFIGLATLARMAFAGADLGPLKAHLLDRLAHNQNDADALMDLSTVLHLTGQRQLGLSMQALALDIRQLYRLRCSANPARIRLLGILSPGDLAENNALEFLTEGSDIALDLLYVSPDLPFPESLPDHDVAMVAVCENDRNRPLLKHIETLVKSWPRPVLCAPDRIARLSRDGTCALLQSGPGVVVPVTTRIDRQKLESIGRSELAVAAVVPDGVFPIIVRPVDSQKGRGLRKLDGPDAIVEYLESRPENAFYAARYVDYRGPDGQFRKYRVVLIDERPYACHMAVSDDWVVHYISAGMAGSAAKRAEEARFFASFDDDFARRHHDALLSIAKRLELEYVGIDCGETADGELLIFEVDSGMTIHSMDPVDVFPYKQPQMRKVFRAFRRMLIDASVKHGNRNGVAPGSGKVNPRNSLNFSGGPGALPESVLLQVQEAIIEVPEVGLSVLGISHRSDWFAAVISELENNIRTLLGLSRDYHVLLLQGGATQQFSMVPMTLLRGKARAAEYLHTGYWSGKALPDARREGQIRVVWSGETGGFRRLPGDDELSFSADAPYIHYVSNETVEGLQFDRVLGRDDVPRVCDMSSDFLSKPCEAERFSLIYAHAQKNIGPAGVTVVLIRDELLNDAPGDLPGMLDYRNHIQAHSNFNTPPVFAIYVVLLVTRWLMNEIGGVERMARINRSKAELLYSLLDRSDGFYRGRVDPQDRSLMNVSFNLSSPEMEKRFLAEALAAGFSGLSGHRSIGGVRASIYNALTLPAVGKLVDFMEDFERRQLRSANSTLVH